MFSLPVAEVLPAWSCPVCFQQQPLHGMWLGDTSAWQHRDVTAQLRTLLKTTLIYPFNVSLCSQTLTCLVQLPEPETPTGKAHPRSILLFTWRWFNLSPCSSCRYCARNSALEEGESVAQGNTSTYLNIKHLLFTLFLLQRNGAFPFWLPLQEEQRVPQDSTQQGSGCPEFTEKGQNRASTLTKHWVMKNT